VRWFSLALLFSLAAYADDGDDDGAAELEVPSRALAPPIAKVTSIAPERDVLARAVFVGGKLYVQHEGANRQLTIDAALQEQLTTILRDYETPYAAVVAVEPATGRVLAMAEHSEAVPGLRGLATRALYPAASIFKIVTAAALLDVGVSPGEELCAWGGKRKVTPAQLVDSEKDTRCLTLSRALAVSANVLFAKFTSRYLDAEKLKQTARAFHFNVPFRFAVPTDMSLASVPSDTYDLATTGAGFGDVYLSPLHGALLASVAANHGLWRAPVLFEDEVPREAPTERVTTEAVAEQLTAMMEETITDGTGRRIFHERGMRVPGAVGKTGSLADKTPFRDYTWFVGFAPKEAPRVAVAAVIVNDPHWRIRATWLGREAMRLFLTKAK
jgi:cell division protein FtsI/penicillin-binding protein 2